METIIYPTQITKSRFDQIRCRRQSNKYSPICKCFFSQRKRLHLGRNLPYSLLCISLYNFTKQTFGFVSIDHNRRNVAHKCDASAISVINTENTKPPTTSNFHFIIITTHHRQIFVDSQLTRVIARERPTVSQLTNRPVVGPKPRIPDAHLGCTLHLA